MIRAHLLAFPNVQTTWAYDLDGFNVMCMRFARLLKERLGAYVLLYGGEENDAPCDELITVTTKAEQAQHYGEGRPYQHARIEADNPLWQLFNKRAAGEIATRKQPRDYIFTLGGGSQASITMAHPDLMAVEYSIGYVGNYARNRVFQSQAWRHYCYGAQGVNSVRHFDEVIPGFFETEKFRRVEKPADYVLYVGRYMPRKGLGIVQQAAQLAGVPLKCVGHGDPSLITYGEDLGAVNEATRNELMANARALICPTLYVEPYGCISPEAQLCGTPVISTDCGGFTETVEHGVSGFRCNILGEFVDAIRKADTLDRELIQQRAQALYGFDTAAHSYANYFRRLNTLWQRDGGFKTVPFEIQ